jgi:hypothetical protein
MSELKFPFKFRAFDLYPIYTAKYSEKYYVEISWYNDEGELRTRMYNLADVAENVARNIWRIEKPDQTDPDVTIKQSEVDAYVDEINMLRELVAEITLETDYTALGQQASTYRALNEKMTKHRSYKQGDGLSTREGELLEQLDVLFEAYDISAGKQQFKPVSEMTLDDWSRAKKEGWKFSTHYMGDVTVYDVDCQPRDLIPILVENAVGNTWYIGIDGTDIDNEGWTLVKRVK